MCVCVCVCVCILIHCLVYIELLKTDEMALQRGPYMMVFTIVLIVLSRKYVDSSNSGENNRFKALVKNGICCS